MLVDYLIVKVPIDFIRIAWERPLRVRILLSMLYSFKHTLKLAEQAGFTMPGSASQVISEVDSLRFSWFELKTSERLEMLAQLCVETNAQIGSLIRQIDTRLQQDISTLVGKPQRPHSGLFNFVNPWNLSEAMKWAFENYSRTGQVAWRSPASFLQVLAVYSHEHPQPTPTHYDLNELHRPNEPYELRTTNFELRTAVGIMSW